MPLLIASLPSFLTPVESISEIPFSDASQLSSTSELEKEIIALKQENARLQQENERLREELAEAKQIIRRAKNISPVMRLSLKRVMRLAHHACMDIQRTVGGSRILKMGHLARKFRRLADIWDILSQDNWYLSNIFPEGKLISLDKIQPPKPRTRPLITRLCETKAPEFVTHS